MSRRSNEKALVFQYGSNMSTARLNSSERLQGDARPIGIAYTDENYDLLFDIWSTSNSCAAADIVNGDKRIWGVVYEIPQWLVSREDSQLRKRKSLDAIEGEGTNYDRVSIRLRRPDGSVISEAVETYIGRKRQPGITTALHYVRHILEGLTEHKIPTEYMGYVKAQVLANNPLLAADLS